MTRGSMALLQALGYSVLAAVLLLFAVEQARAQGTEENALQDSIWRFVSIPDFLNNDVAYPEPKWDDALDYVLNEIKKEDPAFVLVSGDMVMGRWSQSSDHLWAMADTFYTGWVRRMEAHDLEPYVVVGDHEVGDNPWPPPKARLIPSYRQAFEKYLDMPANGPPGYKKRTYWIRNRNLLVVALDVFETDESGSMRVGVSDQQFAWFERVLERHQDVQHVVVMAHVPILPGWRARSSSRLTLPGGVESGVWQTMAEHDVDLYLCGEVHDISMQQRDDILQVVHGSQPSNVNEFNYLVVTVYPGRLDLQIKKISTTLEGPRDGTLDPYGVDPYRERIVRLTSKQKQQGFSTVGTMTIADPPIGPKRFVNRTGIFKTRYTVFDAQ